MVEGLVFDGFEHKTVPNALKSLARTIEPSFAPPAVKIAEGALQRLGDRVMEYGRL